MSATVHVHTVPLELAEAYMMYAGHVQVSIFWMALSQGKRKGRRDGLLQGQGKLRSACTAGLD